MEVILHTVTAESQEALVRRYRLALGTHAFGARFRYFLKRHNIPWDRQVGYAQEHQAIVRQWPHLFRDTRGLLWSEAGPSFETPDGTEWIVTVSPDGPTCVYRYPRGNYSGRDGWELD